MVEDYLVVNRANWDERAIVHASSTDYALEQFVADQSFLSTVVRFDLPLLGDVNGLEAVHLQCHIGTDTISLARLGAKMTGVDFSQASLEQAALLAERTGSPVRFVQADVYSALSVLAPGAFDLVYTGVGALCWLPDIKRWAETVSGLLRPGGRLFIREMHPMLGTLIAQEGLLVVDDPYFEQPEPMVYDEGGTYVENDHEFAATVTHEWSHGLGETVSALLDCGMQLTGLVEHDSVPWRALQDVMRPDEQGEWRLIDRPWRLAASYTLQAVRS